MNTSKEDRDEAFYVDAFTSMTTWGPGVFEADCAEHGIEYDPDEDAFGLIAEKLWEAYSDNERAEFCSDYDDWLDA